VYWYRKVIPKPLRVFFEKREISVTLRTKERSEAIAAYHEQAALANKLIQQARSGRAPAIDDWEIVTFARAWLNWAFPPRERELMRKYDNIQADDPIPNEILADLIAPFDDEDQLEKSVNEFRQIREEPIEIDEVSYRLQHQACLEEYLTEFPRKPLFKFRSERRVAAETSTGPAQLLETHNDVSLSEIFEKWIAERRPPEKTKLDWKAAIRRFREINGGDIGIQDITDIHCREFKDTLLQLPARMKRKMRKMSVSEIIQHSDSNTQRLSAVAVNKNIAAVQSVLQYAVANKYRKDNPMRGIKAIEPTKGAGRQPLSKLDLEKLFSSGTYRHVESDPRKRNAQFWLPLLAIYTGCRLEEIGQARVSDVRNEQGINYFDVNSLGEGKHLKNRRSERRVPLHPMLIRCGFIEYVKFMQSRGELNLFPDIERKEGAVGARTAAISKKLNRWLAAAGVKKDRSIAFHSTRHSFKDACRQAGIPKDMHDQLTGHASGDVSDEYGHGYSIDSLHKAISKINYGIDLHRLYVQKHR